MRRSGDVTAFVIGRNRSLASAGGTGREEAFGKALGAPEAAVAGNDAADDAAEDEGDDEATAGEAAAGGCVSCLIWARESGPAR